MKTLIKNGRIVTAVDDYVADIFGRRRNNIGDRKNAGYGGGQSH